MWTLGLTLSNVDQYLQLNDQVGSITSQSMKIILFVIGAVAGLLIVRGFFLDTIQIAGWNMFWNRLSEGDLMNPDVVFKSETFMKCIVGMIAGGVLGALLGSVKAK
jgi:uncharacterized membrane protein